MMTTSSDPNEKITVHIDPDLEDLIPGFLERRQGDIQTIRTALEQNDFDAIHTLAHTMKGVGGGYGFDDITTISRAIQQAAEKSDEEGVRKGVDELAGYLERVEVLYE